LCVSFTFGRRSGCIAASEISGEGSEWSFENASRRQGCVAPANSRLKFWGGASHFLRFQCRIYSERCVRPQWVKNNGGCSVSDSSLVDVGAFVGCWMSISDATVCSYRHPLRRAQTRTGADFETAMKSVLCNVDMRSAPG